MFHWFLYQSTRVPPDSYKPLLILTNSHNIPNKVLHGIPTVSRRARGPQKNLSEFSCSVGKISQSFLVLPEKSLRVFFFCQENAFPQFRFSSKTKSLKISENLWKLKMCKCITNLEAFGWKNLPGKSLRDFMFAKKRTATKSLRVVCSSPRAKIPILLPPPIFSSFTYVFTYHNLASRRLMQLPTPGAADCCHPPLPYAALTVAPHPCPRKADCRSPPFPHARLTVAPHPWPTRR